MEEARQYSALMSGGGQNREFNSSRTLRRLRGFRIHLLLYFVAAALLVGIGVIATPGAAWFAWPIVGWGGALALHAAYVMGLIGGGDDGNA